MGNRFIRPFHGVKKDRRIVVGGGVIRREFDGVSVVRYRLRHAALALVRHGEAEMRFGRSGIGGDGAPIGGAGLVEISLRAIDGAEIVVGKCVVGLAGQDRFVAGARRVEVSGLVRAYRAGQELAYGSRRNRRGRALLDRKSTRLNSSHIQKSRMPSSA